jgi:hypothetical protein
MGMGLLVTGLFPYMSDIEFWAFYIGRNLGNRQLNKTW